MAAYPGKQIRFDRFLRKDTILSKSVSIFVPVALVTLSLRHKCAIDLFWKSNWFPPGFVFKSLAAKNKFSNHLGRLSFIFKVSIRFNTIVTLVTNVLASCQCYLLHSALIRSIFHPFFIKKSMNNKTDDVDKMIWNGANIKNSHQQTAIAWSTVFFQFKHNFCETKWNGHGHLGKLQIKKSRREMLAYSWLLESIVMLPVMLLGMIYLMCGE